MSTLLSVNQINKRFGTQNALKNLSFAVQQGEVVGLAGLSGAGKSVLAKIIAGLHRPSSGTVIFDGEEIRHPFQITNHNIGFIHQYPYLVNELNITDNIFMGRELLHPIFGKFFKMVDEARMIQETHRIISELDTNIGIDEVVGNLNGEQRQLVAIARAKAHLYRLMVIDEPTLQLSYSSQQKLLNLIQQWQSEGRTIIFGSTNLDHLFAVTDRILVLRQGSIVATFTTDLTTREQVVAAMVGQSNQEHLTPVIWALENYYQAQERADELVEQTNLLEQNLQEQGSINQELVAQLAKQVKALDQANQALQDAHRRLLTEREQERKHLARELHDQVIQDLLSTNYEIETVQSRHANNPDYMLELNYLRQNLSQMVEDIRRICGNLRPPTIDSLGLVAAIQSYVNDWSHRTGILVKLTIDDIRRLPESTELSIFRIIQEGLNNVYRHSDATDVEIILKHTSPRTLMVTIADNGIGIPDDFDLAVLSAKGHYGLLGISERVSLLQGNLRFQNRDDNGFAIQVEIPHPRITIQ